MAAASASALGSVDFPEAEEEQQQCRPFLLAQQRLSASDATLARLTALDAALPRLLSIDINDVCLSDRHDGEEGEGEEKQLRAAAAAAAAARTPPLPYLSSLPSSSSSSMMRLAALVDVSQRAQRNQQQPSASVASSVPNQSGEEAAVAWLLPLLSASTSSTAIEASQTITQAVANFMSRPLQCFAIAALLRSETEPEEEENDGASSAAVVAGAGNQGAVGSGVACCSFASSANDSLAVFRQLLLRECGVSLSESDSLPLSSPSHTGGFTVGDGSNALPASSPLVEKAEVEAVAAALSLANPIATVPSTALYGTTSLASPLRSVSMKLARREVDEKGQDVNEEEDSVATVVQREEEKEETQSAEARWRARRLCIAIAKAHGSAGRGGCVQGKNSDAEEASEVHPTLPIGWRPDERGGGGGGAATPTSPSPPPEHQTPSATCAAADPQLSVLFHRSHPTVTVLFPQLLPIAVLIAVAKALKKKTLSQKRRAKQKEKKAICNNNNNNSGGANAAAAAAFEEKESK